MMGPTDREERIIDSITALAKIVNSLMDDVIRMTSEIKEIRKQMNDLSTK